MLSMIGGVLGFFGMIPGSVFPTPFRTVEQESVGLVSHFGKCQRIVDPGLHQINLMTDEMRTVDIKLQVVDLPSQVVMTRDNVSITIDSVLYFRVVDPYVATFLVQNVRSALIERTQTTLRQIAGLRTLQECIELREAIAHDIESLIKGPAEEWGVEVSSILIKDMQMAPELLESLSAAAKQKRIGESKVIAAEAEVQAARLMRNVADLLSSEAAMQIRYLEAMQAMAKTSGAKVIFMPSNPESSAAMMRNVQTNAAVGADL
ncbi:hypothetical protein H9P43_008106 [Blastocladiella emersonii ATCC 22665]|nr:hypothetical protein H9P43_008106 [Blastocladiella emersonii ATCC 22665]